MASVLPAAHGKEHRSVTGRCQVLYIQEYTLDARSGILTPERWWQWHKPRSTSRHPVPIHTHQGPHACPCPPAPDPDHERTPRAPLSTCGCRISVTLCDLGIFVDEAAEPVPAKNAHTGHFARRMRPSGGRVLLHCGATKASGRRVRGAVALSRCPGIPRVRSGTSPAFASGDNPRLRWQVKSGHCQQGSLTVSAAFAGPRARLACTARRAAIPLPAAVQAVV
jgi:hypothetical protein